MTRTHVSRFKKSLPQAVEELMDYRYIRGNVSRMDVEVLQEYLALRIRVHEGDLSSYDATLKHAYENYRKKRKE